MSSRFKFDFDDWAELAKRDPEAFERRRDQVVSEVCGHMNVDSAPAIAGIRWRIDIERKRCTTPMQLCLRLSSLMWDRYLDMNDALNDSLLQKEHNRPRSMPHPESALLRHGCDGSDAGGAVLLFNVKKTEAVLARG